MPSAVRGVEKNVPAIRGNPKAAIIIKDREVTMTLSCRMAFVVLVPVSSWVLLGLPGPVVIQKRFHCFSMSLFVVFSLDMVSLTYPAE